MLPNWDSSCSILSLCFALINPPRNDSPGGFREGSFGKNEDQSSKSREECQRKCVTC
jgi:hypothetical protein